MSISPIHVSVKEEDNILHIHGEGNEASFYYKDILFNIERDIYICWEYSYQHA